MFILVFDQSSIHCALCMYVCVSVSLSECVRETKREAVIGQNSLRSRLGEDYFTLREVVRMRGGTHLCCVFQLFKDILNVHKQMEALVA